MFSSLAILRPLSQCQNRGSQIGRGAALFFFFAFCPAGMCDCIKGSMRCGLFLVVAGEELYLQCDKGETLQGG